jgi:hypothetical protein
MPLRQRTRGHARGQIAAHKKGSGLAMELERHTVACIKQEACKITPNSTCFSSFCLSDQALLMRISSAKSFNSSKWLHHRSFGFHENCAFNKACKKVLRSTTTTQGIGGLCPRVCSVTSSGASLVVHAVTTTFITAFKPSWTSSYTGYYKVTYPPGRKAWSSVNGSNEEYSSEEPASGITYNLLGMGTSKLRHEIVSA